MGLPVPVGTAVIGSLAVDAASYVWSLWQPVTSPYNQNIETWRFTNQVNTACYWSLFISDTQSASGILASSALNGAANQTVNAIYAFDIEARGAGPSGTTLYYNFRPSATTTVRQFWVSCSRSEANL